MLMVVGLLIVVVNLLLGELPQVWGWIVVLIGAACIVAALIWVNNLSEETKRKFMTLSPTARRLFWPFAKSLEFFHDNDALQKEMTKLKGQPKRSSQPNSRSAESQADKASRSE